MCPSYFTIKSLRNRIISAYFISLSTITSIALQTMSIIRSLKFSSPIIKSINISSYSAVSISINYIFLCSVCVLCLFFLYLLYAQIYSITFSFMFRKLQFYYISSIVFLILRQLQSRLLQNYCIIYSYYLLGTSLVILSIVLTRLYQ